MVRGASPLPSARREMVRGSSPLPSARREVVSGDGSLLVFAKKHSKVRTICDIMSFLLDFSGFSVRPILICAFCRAKIYKIKKMHTKCVIFSVFVCKKIIMMLCKFISEFMQNVIFFSHFCTTPNKIE